MCVSIACKNISSNFHHEETDSGGDSILVEVAGNSAHLHQKYNLRFFFENFIVETKQCRMALSMV